MRHFWTDFSQVMPSSDEPSTNSQILDLELPVPYRPEGDVVFIAMDVELFEMNHNVVTEIGFAILDTRSTIGIPPGEKLKNWLALIEARHLRIKENTHAVNRKHVHGCEEFFDFGLVIQLASAARRCSQSNHQQDLGVCQAQGCSQGNQRYTSTKVAPWLAPSQWGRSQQVRSAEGGASRARYRTGY